MDLVEFWTVCSTNGIVLEKEQLWQIERYVNELKYWNEKVNLISRKDEDNILNSHILHSLSCIKYVHFPVRSRILDVGTGGGLPGIPIAIANPESKVTMVDSIAKKIKITDMLAKHTGIRTIRTVNSRAEDLVKNVQFQNYFDFILSRAVAPMSTIVEWTDGIVKKKHKFIFYKGGDITDEINEIKKNMKDIKIIVKQISMIGADYFERDDKKIVIIEKN